MFFMTEAKYKKDRIKEKKGKKINRETHTNKHAQDNYLSGRSQKKNNLTIRRTNEKGKKNDKQNKLK